MSRQEWNLNKLISTTKAGAAKAASFCRYAGVPYNADDLDIALGDIPLMRKGQPLQFDEKAASKYLTDVTSKHDTVYITLNLGGGNGSGTAWVSLISSSNLLGAAL